MIDIADKYEGVPQRYVFINGNDGLIKLDPNSLDSYSNNTESNYLTNYLIDEIISREISKNTEVDTLSFRSSTLYNLADTT